MQVSIVIPVRNEARKRIVPLLEEIVDVMKGADAYEIIVVDDGSNDQTRPGAKSGATACLIALRVIQHGT